MTRTEHVASKAVRYDVFICHRRSDGAPAAALLKRRLREYRLPDGVPDDPDLVRPTSERPLEVFLDADEERTTHDYWEDHIRPALDASRKVIVLWTRESTRRRPGWDPMWAEVDHLVEKGRVPDIILIALGTVTGTRAPGKLTTRFPRMEYRTPVRTSTMLGSGLSRSSGKWRWTVRHSLDPIEFARVAASVCNVASPYLETVVRLEETRDRRRRRRRLAVLTATVGLVVALGWLWLEEMKPGLYAHFLTMTHTMASIESTEPGSFAAVGRPLGTFYSEVWMQRFAGGSVIHPTQLEQAFERTSLLDHTRTLLILRNDASGPESGRFFFRRRPPVPEPPRDVAEFTGWLRGVAKSDDLLLRDGWEQTEGLLEDQITAMYSIHGGDQTISGGFAIAYAIFRLDRFLGRPLGTERSCVAVLRIHEHGYTLLIAGAPPLERDVPPSDELYVFVVEKREEDQETRATAGHVYAWGDWTRATVSTSALERALRPSMPRSIVLRKH